MIAAFIRLSSQAAIDGEVIDSTERKLIHGALSAFLEKYERQVVLMDDAILYQLPGKGYLGRVRVGVSHVNGHRVPIARTRPFEFIVEMRKGDCRLVSALFPFYTDYTLTSEWRDGVFDAKVFSWREPHGSAAGTKRVVYKPSGEFRVESSVGWTNWGRVSEQGMMEWGSVRFSEEQNPAPQFTWVHFVGDKLEYAADCQPLGTRLPRVINEGKPNDVIWLLGSMSAVFIGFFLWRHLRKAKS